MANTDQDPPPADGISFRTPATGSQPPAAATPEFRGAATPPRHEPGVFSIRDQFAGRPEIHSMLNPGQPPPRRPAGAPPPADNRDLFPAAPPPPPAGTGGGPGPGRSGAEAARPLWKRIPADQFLQHLDYLKILIGLYKKKWAIATTAAVCLCCGFLLSGMANLFSASYAATGSLVFQRDRNKSIKPPNQSAFAVKPLDNNTALDMLQLASVFRDVIERANLSAKAEDLVRMMSVQSQKRSEVISVRIKGAPTKKFATDAINSFLDVVVEANANFYRKQVESQVDDFRLRTQEAKQSLDDFSRLVADYQIKHRYLQQSTEQYAYLQQISAISERLNRAKVARDTLTLRVKNYRDLVASLPEEVVRHSFENNPIRRRIMNTETSLLEARTKFGPNNPKVLTLEREIQEMRKMINDKSYEQSMERMFEANPLRDTFTVELLKAEAEQQASENEVAMAEAAIKVQQAKFQDLPRNEQELANLLRQQRAAEDLYLTLRSSLEEAQLATRMNLSDFEVLTRADDAQATRSPLAMVIPLIAFIAGLLGATVFFLLRELGDPYLRTRKQLEAALHAPVLATLPYMPRLTPETAYSILLPTLRDLSEAVPAGATAAHRTIGLLSCTDGEGKSLIGFSLARYFASLNFNVAHVDFDPRPNPLLELALNGRQPATGLEEYLRENVNFQDLAMNLEGMDIFKLQNAPPDLFERLKSPAMNQFWDTLRNTYEIIVMELPPASHGPEAFLLGRLVSVPVLVVGSDLAERRHLELFAEKLDNAGIHPCGAILNRVEAVFIERFRHTVQSSPEAQWFRQFRERLAARWQRKPPAAAPPAPAAAPSPSSSGPGADDAPPPPDTPVAPPSP